MDQNNSITKDVNTLLENTLILFKKLCINPISEKILFFIEYVDEESNNNDVPDMKYKINDLELISLNELIKIIIEIQKSLSWVDFAIIYSNIDLTLVKVTLVKLNKIEGKIDFHANIRLPINYSQNEKFDINELFNIV